MANADGLSRLPMNNTTGEGEGTIHFIERFKFNHISIEQVRAEIEKDNCLRDVLNMLLNGWLNPIPIHIKPFYNKRLSLSIQSGCLWYDHRLVIPITMMSLVLGSLHESHIGIVKMKLLAKNHVWWPEIGKYIEEYISNCQICQATILKPLSSENSNWRILSIFFKEYTWIFFILKIKYFCY